VKKNLVWFAAWAILAGVVIAQESKPKPLELTADQKLAFQSSLTAFFQQTTAYNNLDAQFQRELTDRAKALQVGLQEQGKALQAAEDAVKAACPGELVGLREGKPECKPKALEPVKAPATQAAAPGSGPNGSKAK
jgi:hypothetical protein